MNTFFRFLKGYFFISFSSPRAERILNFLLEKNIPVWGICARGEHISFCISWLRFSDLKPFLETISDGEKLVQEKRGLLRLFSLFRERWGFFFGFLLFWILIFSSTTLVWGVEIVGNKTVSKEEIKEDLAEFGIYPGAKISSFDPKEIGMRYQISGKDFVYVNINIIGTKASVEVREREYVDKNKKEESPCNMVAEIYGTIVRYEVLSGQIQVKPGERVVAGKLLISGIKEKNDGTFQVMPAKGRVFAKTNRSFSVSVPFFEEKRVFTGVEKEKINIEILGVTIPVTLGKNLDTESFEKRETQEDLILFGKRFPIRIKRVSFLEFEEKKEAIILDRARDLAYDKYMEFKRETFAKDDEILEENISFSQDGDGLTLTAEFVLIEDICKEIPFHIY